MSNVLGLLGFVVFILCVIALAAAVTWIVVKVSPAPNRRRESRQSPPS
ncbi:MAG: hypothetical protein WBB74_05240 [Gaiellaceae bacterium]